MLDGRSVLPLARNPLNPYDRDILLETPSYSAIRTPEHVFVQNTTGEQELYDLVSDPHQLQSLHADPGSAELKDDLAARLARLAACAGASCR